MYVLCNKFCSVDVHFFSGGIAPIECYESSNWKNLKRFAPKKNENYLVDASGAHFKVAQGSKSEFRGGHMSIPRIASTHRLVYRPGPLPEAAFGALCDFEVSSRSDYWAVCGIFGCKPLQNHPVRTLEALIRCRSARQKMCVHRTKNNAQIQISSLYGSRS